jgi:branched-chain amino acid transport system permease protein
MLYREVGQFKTSYAADQAIFPIAQERWIVVAFLGVAFLVVPFFVSSYSANAVLLPFLIFGLAALGLNILTGYCGQLSLGTGAFLGVGAYASFKLMTAFPDLNLVIVLVLSGLVTAAVGMLFGLPSLRIKGFYLAVATLAAQFFLVWLFYRWGWLRNDNATGQITVPPRDFFGVLITGPSAAPWAKYLFTLGVVVLLAFGAKNLARGRAGRSWMAIRDMDIAAELIGIKPLGAKMTAFGVSSFYIGVAGALMFAVWLGAAEAGETFGIQNSFLILFMIIIGGLGTVLGSFLGAGFLVLMPILLKNTMVDALGVSAVNAKHLEYVIMGLLIIVFLIIEPHGLARLWQIMKEKLRLWPFPY